MEQKKILHYTNEQIFQNKVYIFTTILSFLVIYAHSYNAELFLQNNYPKLMAIQGIIVTISQLAVPSFFMLSSYLFFRGININNLKRKLKRRFISLLIPYLAWNSIYYLGYIIATHLPILTNIVGKGIIQFTLHDALLGIFFYRYHYVFWFVFQLILLISISPLLYFILRNFYFGFFVLFLSLYLVYLGIDGALLNSDALFYYILAGYTALHFPKVIESLFSPISFCIGLFFLSISFILSHQYLESAKPIYAVLYRSMAGVGLWLILYIPSNLHLPNCFRHSFFVYATHFALVRLINKVSAYLFYGNSLLAMFLFFFMPFIILALTNLLIQIIQYICPKTYDILSGGR